MNTLRVSLRGGPKGRRGNLKQSMQLRLLRSLRSLAMTAFFVYPVFADEPIEPISIDPITHKMADMPSLKPSMSADGTIVVFESYAKLMPNDPTNARDVYIFDRHNKMFKRAPVEKPQYTNQSPRVDHTGRFIVYESYSPEVFRSTIPRISDITLYDQVENHATAITNQVVEDENSGESLDPSVTPNGRFILFTSNATRMAGLPRSPHRKVYLYDRYQSILDVMSQSAEGKQLNRLSGDPRMSADSQFIAFKSYATNILGDLPIESLTPHLYLLDRREWKFERVDDVKHGFDPKKWVVDRYDMDEKGDVLVYETRQKQIRDPKKSLETVDLFTFERSSGTTRQLSTGDFSGRAHSPSLSGDGRFVAFILAPTEKPQRKKGGLIIYDRMTKAWKQVVNGACFNPSFAKDGGWVAFESSEHDLGPGARQGVSNIYVVKNPYANH